MKSKPTFFLYIYTIYGRSDSPNSRGLSSYFGPLRLTADLLTQQLTKRTDYRTHF